jgi:hypothetical protein
LKRLIKKSIFFNIYKPRYEREWDDRIEYASVYVNPSKDEMNQIIQETKKFVGSDDCDIRMLINQEGRIYAWDGFVIHGEMKRQLPDAENDIHIAYQFKLGNIYMHSIGDRNKQQFVEAMKNAKANLTKAGVIDTCMISDIPGVGFDEKDFPTLSDIYNYELEKEK